MTSALPKEQLPKPRRVLGALWRAAQRVERAIDRATRALNPYDVSRLRDNGLEPILLAESEIKRNTIRWTFIALGAFMVWAVVAPLDAGVNVTGTVVVKGHRKAVQHPNGGVIQAVLTKEGATVKQGEVLLKVNPLSSEAELSGVEMEYFTALAAESRLLSEQGAQPQIRWIDELEITASIDPRLQEAKQLQQKIFESRRSELANQQNILREQVAGLEKQVKELEQVLAVRKEQLQSLTAEVESNKALAAEGFVPLSRANEIERTRSDLIASISSVASELSKTRSAIAGSRLQLLQVVSTYRKDVDTQLADVQKNRKGLSGRVDSLRFTRELAEVRAPVAGVVVGMKVNTVGGVIKGGDLLMEIVPVQERLVIQAQVPPALIDKVHVKLDADLRFTAFNVNRTPVIPGTVTLVGADRVSQPSAATGRPEEFYLAEIEITAPGRELMRGLTVQPGMPVDVIIKTGERSFMSYLLKPLTDRFARAFHED